MTPAGPTPDPPTPPQSSAEESDAGKTRMTQSTEWSGDASLPPTGTAPTPSAGTARSPFGPGNEPPGPEALPASLQGRYRLIRVLGQGGFANVYLAHDGVLDQEVAIKILRLGMASQNDRDRFLLEARIGAKLRHPNIVTVFDIVQTGDGLQMVMEYYPGGTLTERIRNKGALHPRDAIDFIRQVALALAYAHRHSVIHRDVKPANIFMAGDGIVKLGDFGIATHSDRHEFTQTGMIIGTPLYMPPEQSSDSRDVDPRTDIFALGLTLYHTLTGRPPRVVDLDSIPEAFRRLLKLSIAPERVERLVSAEQFIAMLDQVQERLVAARPAGPGAPVAGDAPHSAASTPTSPPFTTTETAILTPTPPPLLTTPTPTPQPRAPQAPPPPPPAAPVTAVAVQAETLASPSPGLPPSGGIPADAGTPQPLRPAPAAPVAPVAPVARRSWLPLAGAVAILVILFFFFSRENWLGNKKSSKALAEATPQPTAAPTPARRENELKLALPTAQPTPAATATPTATARSLPAEVTYTRPPKGGPGPGRFNKGEGRPPFRPGEKAAIAAEMMRKRALEKQQAANPTPSPSPTPAPTLTPVDDLARIEQAYQRYLGEHRGVASALEIIRDGGKDLPPSMRDFELSQARSTLLESLKKTPGDPILNMIVGFMYVRLDNPAMAPAFFEQAVALDRKSPAPLNLNTETLQRFQAKFK